MPQYFYVVPGRRFVTEIQPPLAQAWRKRSFEPCRSLCRELAETAHSFAVTHRIDPDALFIERVAMGMPFSKDACRSLVSDLITVSAVMMPEIQTAPQTLRCLLSKALPLDGGEVGGGEHFAKTIPPAAALSHEGGGRETPIDQAHFGARDLVFGGGFYRPEHAGWNDESDVARLADYLASVDPRTWHAGQLAPLTEIAADDREEEVEFARQSMQNLAILYQSARDGHVIVCEVI